MGIDNPFADGRADRPAHIVWSPTHGRDGSPSRPSSHQPTCPCFQFPVPWAAEPPASDPSGGASICRLWRDSVPACPSTNRVYNPRPGSGSGQRL